MDRSSHLNAQQLLDEVILWCESHKKANQLFSRQLAPDFKLFSLFKIDELRLSQCIAFLLDEHEVHGQRDLFINKFYNLFHNHKAIKLKADKYTVHTEYTIDNGRRIDILLTDNQNIIAIENKPWADDQLAQLKDYGEWLKQKTKNTENWLLIYLCKYEWSENSLPANTDNSIKNNILHITFYELLDWLMDCLLYVQAPKIRLFIEGLIEYIQENINGEIDMSQQNELTKMILAKPENIRAAFLIEQNIKELKKELFQKFINYLINKTSDLGIKIESDIIVFDKRYSGFQVKFDDKDRFLLRWECAASGLKNIYYGICRKDSSVQQDTKTYQKIAEKMKEIQSSPEQTEYWPAWDWNRRNSMPNSIDDKIWSEFSTPEKSEFAKSVIEIISMVYRDKELRELLK